MYANFEAPDGHLFFYLSQPRLCAGYTLHKD